mmetsp:Transcript_128676/g.333611  ORF Transcript_128676/g.333611 Transcript_128676/m.333611 type:complete len:119 (-) Transcript_128676:25-381(-)
MEWLPQVRSPTMRTLAPRTTPKTTSRSRTRTEPEEEEEEEEEEEWGSRRRALVSASCSASRDRCWRRPRCHIHSWPARRHACLGSVISDAMVRRHYIDSRMPAIAEPHAEDPGSSFRA